MRQAFLEGPGFKGIKCEAYHTAVRSAVMQKLKLKRELS
jgi:hypothetical protein